jgi:hypothetical protein
MDRLSPMTPGGVDDLLDAQVTFQRRRRSQMGRLVRHPHGERGPVGIGEDCNTRDSRLAQRPDDPHRDFASIGDQHLPKHET